MCSLAVSASAAGQVRPDQSDQTVKVQRIKPADLPSASESKIPAVLRSKNLLPRAARLEELRALGGIVRPTIIRVMAIHEPRSSLQRDGIVLEGHALWLTTQPGKAILVSPHHWLDGAARIYALPWEEMESGGLPKARVLGMNSVSVRGKIRELERREDLVRMKLTSPDKHRNLVTLTADRDDVPAFLRAPEKPLTFFDLERQSPMNTYGLSPMVAPDPIQAIFIPLDPTDEVYAYYLQTDFPVGLGAPVVALEGGIVAITAMPHPNEAGRTLVIPPLALRTYVETVQGKRDPKLSETIEDPDRPLSK